MASVLLFLSIVGWVLGWILFGRVRRLPRAGDAELPPVDLVIPARNEAHNLPNVLGDLAANPVIGMRVVVVDDHSTDGTAEVAGRFDFVEVVEAPELPDGWTGKNWACHTGARHAPRDGALVFLDADIRLHDRALRRAVVCQQSQGGLLSIWPYHQVKRPYEYLSALFNVIAMVGVGCGSLIPMRRKGALGPVVVTTRRDYERLGGHEAIKGCVVDDYELGLRFSDAGERVDTVGGYGDVSFRMYPNGIGSLIEGWTKNAALGLGGATAWRSLAVVLWLAAAGWFAFHYDGGPASPGSWVLMAAFALQMFVIFRQVGSFGVVAALLYLVIFWFTAAVFLRSLVHTYLLGRVQWHGRSISTRKEREPDGVRAEPDGGLIETDGTVQEKA